MEIDNFRAGSCIQNEILRLNNKDKIYAPVRLSSPKLTITNLLTNNSKEAQQESKFKRSTPISKTIKPEILTPKVTKSPTSIATVVSPVNHRINNQYVSHYRPNNSNVGTICQGENSNFSSTIKRTQSQKVELVSKPPSKYISPYRSNISNKVAETPKLNTNIFNTTIKTNNATKGQEVTTKNNLIKANNYNENNLSPSKNSKPIRPNLINNLLSSKLIANNSEKKDPGVLYIFHHDEFKNLEFRTGSKHDVKLIQETFKKFNIKSSLHENYTRAQIKKLMSEISVKDFKRNSCIIFVILTHGSRMEEIAAHDNFYLINDDVVFEVIKNETLIGKPKIFIIQACKGDFYVKYCYTDSIRTARSGIPDEIYKFYSTSEGFVSYRDSSGTIFIQELCKELQRSGKTKNIRKIMEITIQNVKKETYGKQIPSMNINNTYPYIIGN